MKKHFIWLFLSFFLLGGCTITYSSNVNEDQQPPYPQNPPSSSPSEENESEEDNQNQETPSTPDIAERITIDSQTYFYPITLSKTSDIITQYSYIYEGKIAQYQIYSAYYSEYYNTLYIAYDNLNNPTQSLKAKDLYEIERHALNYFITDNNKTDYKEYLKAVLIYPDTLASSCRKNVTDENSISINGCANYVGKEAIISLNRLSSLEQFYNEQRIDVTSNTYYQIEGLRYTFAHEFGHISTFYNMAYKNDEDYEDYLKLRLGDYYDAIYPNGLPSSYNSQNSGYYTQPTEILADDYVELFYDTSSKVDEDIYEYTLNQEYSRNSLKNYPAIKNLKDNQNLYNIIKSYYTENFLDYTYKTHYDKPIVIQSLYTTVTYYESFSKIGKTGMIKEFSSDNPIYLIAVGEVRINNAKYYRVILSNTFNITNNSYDEKEVGKKMGYVKDTEYDTNNTIKIYSIDYNRKENTKLAKYSMVPIEYHKNIYVLPYYDFSYVLSISATDGISVMYDYLNKNITNDSYQVSIYSFGTLIN